MGREPKSLGRVAFDAWMSGEVVTEVAPGRWAMTRPKPDDFSKHWRGLHAHHRKTWEEIGQAVREHLEGLEEAGTYIIEVD